MDTLIPPNRDTMTTGERCSFVAKILREHPERHDQSTWYDDDDYGHLTPAEAAMIGSCGTAACVAGWAVACSPPDLVRDAVGFRDAGARALGIETNDATYLFSFSNERAALIDALERLALLPETDRLGTPGWEICTEAKYGPEEGRQARKCLEEES